MQTQEQIEQQVETGAGTGEWQSKLAEALNKYKNMHVQGYQLEKRRRGVHQNVLAAGIRQNEALREACLTMVKCLNNHEDRENFAKDMCEHFK